MTGVQCICGYSDTHKCACRYRGCFAPEECKCPCHKEVKV